MAPTRKPSPPVARPRERSAEPSLAVIWDMDGVIVDSAQLHFRSWRAAFRAYQSGYTYEDFRHTFGQKNDVAIRSILGDRVGPELIDSITRKKEDCFRSLVKSGELEVFPGTSDLIRGLHQAGFKLAVASSAPAENIGIILRRLRLKHYFPVVVSAEDVTEGKPAPRVFLLAAERLGVAPEQCLVIEDAVAGVEASKRAGMKCIAVTNTNTAASLKAADLVVDSLKEVSVQRIQSLIGGT